MSKINELELELEIEGEDIHQVMLLPSATNQQLLSMTDRRMEY